MQYPRQVTVTENEAVEIDMAAADIEVEGIDAVAEEIVTTAVEIALQNPRIDDN
jgi:hypothetical protein